METLHFLQPVLISLTDVNNFQISIVLTSKPRSVKFASCKRCQVTVKKITMQFSFHPRQKQMNLSVDG